LVNVEERYSNYLRFLNELYEKAEGSEIPLVNMWEIGEKIGTGGHPSIETHNIVKWLTGEDLIKGRAVGGIIGLTHRGIREVEDARRHPERSTEHFPSNVINNVINNFGTMYNPALQQGTSNSNQTITITQQQHESIIEAIRQIKEIVQQQGESIPDEKCEELEREIALAEIESKANKPKWERLKGYLTSTKNIAEGTAIAVSLVPKIMPILGMLGG
jgi:hypothetical protein